MSEGCKLIRGDLKLNSGTYSERPSSPSEGIIRHNSTYDNIEGYSNGSWKNFLNKSNCYQNAIINGNMEIWQDGTSFAAIAANHYAADIWRYTKNGAMVHTASRDTDTPNNQLNYSLKIDTTTADAAIAASDLCAVQTFIEGYDWKKFVGKYITLSFWVKSVLTGTYCLSLQNAGVDRSYVAEYTINTASTWEYKTITIPLNYSGGTWNYTNGRGIIIEWVLDMGSTYHITANSWQNGNYRATSNQVNFSASTDNNFWLTGVQLNEGQEASPWNPRSFAKELELCQRYYEMTYDYGTTPGTVTDNGCRSKFHASTTFRESTGNYFQEKKRTTPSVTLYATDSGTSGKIRNKTDNADVAGTASDIGEKGFYISATTTANKHYAWHWVANARF